MDDQTIDEYNAFEVGCIDRTVSQDDSINLMVTTIQKLSNACKSDRYNDLMESFRNDLLKEEGGMTYEEAWKDEEYRPVVEEWSLSHLGYVIEPGNLFRNLIKKINERTFSVEDYERAIKKVSESTFGQP